MLKFKEVKEGYSASDEVEIIRVAESLQGDLMTLVKLKDEEQYQLSLTLENGADAFDTYFDFEYANRMFEHILAIKDNQ